jgi:hypothetical protein
MASNNEIHTIEIAVKTYNIASNDSYGPCYYAEDWFEII